MAHHQAQVLQAQEQVYSGLVLTLPSVLPATQAGVCTIDLHYAMNGPSYSDKQLGGQLTGINTAHDLPGRAAKSSMHIVGNGVDTDILAI